MPAMPTMQQSLVLLYIVDANAAPNCLLPDVALQGSVELTLMNSTPTDLCFFFKTDPGTLLRGHLSDFVAPSVCFHTCSSVP